MGFSHGDFIRSQKVELKENYTKWNTNGEAKYFTRKVTGADFVFLTSSLK